MVKLSMLYPNREVSVRYSSRCNTLTFRIRFGFGKVIMRTYKASEFKERFFAKDENGNWCWDDSALFSDLQDLIDPYDET